MLHRGRTYTHSTQKGHPSQKLNPGASSCEARVFPLHRPAAAQFALLSGVALSRGETLEGRAWPDVRRTSDYVTGI